MFFPINSRLKELRYQDKVHRILGKPRPKELIEYEEAEKSLGFWEVKFWQLWLMAQSWSEAGKIDLQTLKICCEDAKLPFCRWTRRIIQSIEQQFRSFKNG